MREMVLVEAPSNLGLKEPQAGVEPGVKYFAEALKKEGFAEMAGIEKSIHIEPPAYSMDVDAESLVRNTDKIIHYSKELGNAIYKLFQENALPIVIGGDCSILIGAATGLKQKGDYALFYIDGHTDYVLPEQSGSAGAAGMDLAIITGNGHDKLTNIENGKPYIKEENVFCFGNRDYVDWYIDMITQSSIHYFDLRTIRATGISTIIQRFLEMITAKKLDGFWIHFDVDVLNDEIMPCVDSRQEDGLSYAELKQTLQGLILSPYFHGINITILDPTLDKEGMYTKQFALEMAGILKQLTTE